MSGRHGIQRVVFSQRASDLAEALALKLAAEGQPTVVLRTFTGVAAEGTGILQAEQFNGLKLGIFDLEARSLLLSIAAIPADGFACIVVVVPDHDIVPRPVGSMALALQLSRSGRSSGELLTELAELVAHAGRHRRSLLWIDVLNDEMTTIST